MKKIIIIIIFAIVIILCILFLVKTPVFLKNMNTKANVQGSISIYKNDVYKYTFEYPVKWGNRNYYEQKVVLVSSNESKEDILGGFFRVSFHDENPENISIKTWWENNGPQNGRQAPYPDEQKVIQVAGQDAYYTRYDSEANAFGYNKLSAVFIYVAHNGKVYEISGGALPPDPEQSGLTETEITTIKQYEQVFQKILESFTFID